MRIRSVRSKANIMFGIAIHRDKCNRFLKDLEKGKFRAFSIQTGTNSLQWDKTSKVISEYNLLQMQDY